MKDKKYLTDKEEEDYLKSQQFVEDTKRIIMENKEKVKTKHIQGIDDEGNIYQRNVQLIEFKEERTNLEKETVTFEELIKLSQKEYLDLLERSKTEYISFVEIMRPIQLIYNLSINKYYETIDKII